MRLRHEFVEHVPEQLVDGVLYVSIRYGTVVHKCACGCGMEVVTPLGPAEWSLTYDGKTISLAPSVGNWGFPCRSHYWIDGGNVCWARDFTRHEVAQVRRKARSRRDGYYESGRTEETGLKSGRDALLAKVKNAGGRSKPAMLQRLLDFLRTWARGRK